MKFKDCMGMIGAILVGCIMMVLTISFVNYIDKAQEKNSTNYQKRMDLIGNKIVIDKDTLTIINYNAKEETFDLSNRLEINARVIENK
jgi:hypothetical protein